MAGDLSTAIELSDGGDLQASFVPGAGMICCSLRHRGQELLAQNSGVDAYAAEGRTMGIPLLYPWANRLAGFEYEVASRKVAVPHDPSRIAVDERGLPIHGVIGGRMPWEPAAAPAGEARSLAARLSWSEARPELFEVFPFRHDLVYEARMDDGRLEIELTVHASGEDRVPLAFGFHPYLCLPGVPRERWLIELPAMRALAVDAQQIPTGSAREQGRQRFELADRVFDDGFDGVAEPAAFAACAADRAIRLELIEGYPCGQVFAPAGGQFICFEPMTAPANALRSGTGLRLLEPGGRFRARFSVGVADRPSS